uniref:Right handed beta helix domain-containing protein n=1 Tax=Cryptomonas curvata TaxID=233186 RepID=A0A7S0MH22_9CRYP
MKCFQGSPKISNCDCSGATSSVVGICGGATPMLTGCKIHGSIHGCGVCVFQGGKGELSENEIYQNAMSGVEIFGEETEIEVRANRIHSNRGDGVLVYDSGKCTLTSNTVEKNFHAGVEVRDKGLVTAQENSVARNNFGFIIARHASAMLEANRVIGNFITGVEVSRRNREEGSVRTVLRRNDIRYNLESGVKLWYDSNPRLDGNVVAANLEPLSMTPRSRKRVSMGPEPEGDAEPVAGELPSRFGNNSVVEMADVIRRLRDK